MNEEPKPPEPIKDIPEAIAMWRYCKAHGIPIHIAEVDLKKIGQG